MTPETKTDIPDTEPRFSILIPAYNAEDTLPRALDSLLAQTCVDWECIVVDDGSTDDTAEILKQYHEQDRRTRSIYQANSGTAAALDRAAQESRGQALVQFGADDELMPDYCADTARLMDQQPEFDIYAANAWQMLPNGKKRLFNGGERFQHETSLSLEDIIRKPLIYGTAALRRGVYEKVGGFSSANLHEDYDFWLKALMLGARHIFQPMVLSIYHLSKNQKTSDSLRNRIADLDLISALAANGQLSEPELLAVAERQVDLKRNIAIRKRMYRFFGKTLSEKLIALAKRDT